MVWAFLRDSSEMMVCPNSLNSINSFPYLVKRCYNIWLIFLRIVSNVYYFLWHFLFHFYAKTRWLDCFQSVFENVDKNRHSVLCVCHVQPSSILICVTLQLESQAGALSLPGFTCDRRLTSPSPPHLINTLFQIGPKQAFSIFLQQFHDMTMFHVTNQLKYKDFPFPFDILP